MLFRTSLTFAVVLQLLHTTFGDDARYSYKISGSDGSTMFLSVSQKIDPELKKQVMKLDGAAAYNKFLEGYGKYLNNPRLLMSADPTSRKNLDNKRKKEFVKSLDKVK